AAGDPRPGRARGSGPGDSTRSWPRHGRCPGNGWYRSRGRGPCPSSRPSAGSAAPARPRVRRRPDTAAGTTRNRRCRWSRPGAPGASTCRKVACLALRPGFAALGGAVLDVVDEGIETRGGHVRVAGQVEAGVEFPARIPPFGGAMDEVVL